MKEARARFDQGQEAIRKQRQRELDDLAFYAGDQWEAEAKAAREGQSASGGMPPVPARPTYVVNKVREPVRQVLNQERQSDMGIELVAADDFASLTGAIDDTEIELREGLARRIQRSSEAADARTWAFSRATIAGVGYYVIRTRFLPGKTWDKEVYIDRIFNQSSVTLDPAHEHPDGGSDSEWGFVGNDNMSWGEYKTQFPKAARRQKNSVAQSSDKEFRALGEDFKDWFTFDSKTKDRTCRVVEYWYTERESRTLVLLADNSSAWKDELPAETPSRTGEDLTDEERANLTPNTIVDERDVTEKKIKWAKIDGIQVLEETDWEGPDLPIVKVLGEELQPYDAERRVEGMVRSARDSQKGFNAMVSKGVEEVGLSPIPPWQATPEQIEGFEAFYQYANTRAIPVLYYNRVSENGEALGPPVRTPMATDITAIFASMQMFDEAIQSTTGVPEARQGRNVQSKLKSGVAMKEASERSEKGTSNYLDNLRRSIRYEGQIINNLLYAIYGKKPGRLTRIVTNEGESIPAAVNGPPPQQNNAVPSMGNAQLPAKAPKQYTLTQDANFNVIVKVTRSFDSRREQEATIIGDLLNANPQMMTIFGDLFFKNQDGPGHQEMAERAKVMLDPKITQMLQAKEQGGGPPNPQMQAMQQQIQHAEQAMQQMHAEMQGKQNELQSRERIAAEDRASKERIAAADREAAAMDREVKLAVAELGAKVDRMQLFLDERARVGAQAHESALSAQEHAQTLEQQRGQQMHAAGMAAAGGAASADEAEAGRQHASELQSQQLDATAQQQQQPQSEGP